MNRFRGAMCSTSLVVFLLSCTSRAGDQEQPIEYPHNKHIALDLACVDCHSRVETRSEASLPSVAKCMLCHAKLANEGPGVKLLIEYAERGREVPWRRVYGFTKEAQVIFRHAPHVRAGVACEICHGNVAEMTVAERVVNHNMGTCLNCHRQNRASEDCAACHY